MIRKFLALVFAALVIVVVTVDYLKDQELIDAVISTSISDPALMSYQIDAIAEEIADYEEKILELSEELQSLVEEQANLLEMEK